MELNAHASRLDFLALMPANAVTAQILSVLSMIMQTVMGMAIAMKVVKIDIIPPVGVQ